MKARDEFRWPADVKPPVDRWVQAVLGWMGAAVVVALIAFGAHLDAVDDSSAETQQLAAAERKRLAMAELHPQVLAAYEQGLADGTAAMQVSAVCAAAKER